MDGSLLFSVFVFLAATCCLVPIAKLTGLGSVIGYLLAGILIGPFALGLIEDPLTILHFSEFGVVMMLFLIGLELQPRHLWDMRGRLVGLGGLQVLLSTLVITLVIGFFGLEWAPALVIGMGLALSSTAIAVQTMQDRGIMKTHTGEAGFSVLLFQDVIVIAMIAVLPFIAVYAGFDPDVGADVAHSVQSHAGDEHGAAHTGPQGVMLAVAIFAVFGGMILAGRLLLKPLFRLIARSGVRETFTAMALLLVVGAALLMNWLGLSAALGAFMAGVVLADSDYRHQLERDIEPFKALLLGLFFISVGMSLDLIVLAHQPALIVGAVLGLMLCKFVILFGVGRIFKLETSSNLLFASLLCQAGEFGFVLFQFAALEGALPAAWAVHLNAIIALSMALTPFILIIYDKLVIRRFNAPVKTGEHPENQHHRVLILGFGRVGQVIARLLHTQDIETTIIDHDGDHIEFIKQFGYRVFYGDAVDIDLLHQAGAGEVELIIVAIDNPDKTTQIVREAKQHFPQARIVARARNRRHLFDLLAENVTFAERETIRGSLSMGRRALEFMGYTSAHAQKLSDDFLGLDYKIVEESYALRDDLSALAAKATASRDLLKQTLNAEQKQNQTDS